MDALEWIAPAMVAIVTFISSKPLIVRVIMTQALKMGFRWLLKQMAEIRQVYPVNTPEYMVAKEGSEAVEALAKYMASKLGIYAYPQKHQEPKAVKKMLKKNAKQTRKERKRDMKKRRKHGGGMNYLRIILLVIVLFSPVMCDAIEPVEPMIDGAETREWFPGGGTAVAYDLKDWQLHEYLYITFYRPQELLGVRLDGILQWEIGVIDPTDIEYNGEEWQKDIKPATSISIDFLKLGEVVPYIGELLEKRPNWLRGGAGIYGEYEDDFDIQPMVHLQINVEL